MSNISPASLPAIYYYLLTSSLPGVESHPMTSYENITSDPGAEDAGFRFGDKGTHTSRTMMLAELTDALEATQPEATREDYASAIIDDNVLGKQTMATRRLSNQRLGELYGLSRSIPLFRVLRRIWDIDEVGRPLTALLCALARDPLLRATAGSVLPLPVGGELLRTSMSGSIRAATGNRLNESILDKVARNAASSWSQSGHLLGRVRKIRQEVRPTPGPVAFALWLGSLYGLAGEDLLRSPWARTLDQSPVALLELTLRAKQIGLINANAGGGVIEIDVSPLNSTRGFY
jgi:hypothetical protein